MKVSKKLIAHWIDEYCNSTSATAVLNRKLSEKLIHRLQCDRKEGDLNVSKRWLAHINDELPSFNDCSDFESILKKVEELSGKFYGIGRLTVYDTATCIGCPKKIRPTDVYIHAGTSVGAKAIGIKGNVVPKSEFVKVCKAFAKLEPMQIEDFLCIYKSYLSGEVDTCAKVRKRCICSGDSDSNGSC